MQPIKVAIQLHWLPWSPRYEKLVKSGPSLEPGPSRARYCPREMLLLTTTARERAWRLLKIHSQFFDYVFLELSRAFTFCMENHVTVHTQSQTNRNRNFHLCPGLALLELESSKVPSHL